MIRRLETRVNVDLPEDLFGRLRTNLRAYYEIPRALREAAEKEWREASATAVGGAEELAHRVLDLTAAAEQQKGYREAVRDPGRIVNQILEAARSGNPASLEQLAIDLATEWGAVKQLAGSVHGVGELADDLEKLAKAHFKEVMRVHQLFERSPDTSKAVHLGQRIQVDLETARALVDANPERAPGTRACFDDRDPADTFRDETLKARLGYMIEMPDVPAIAWETSYLGIELPSEAPARLHEHLHDARADVEVYRASRAPRETLPLHVNSREIFEIGPGAGRATSPLTPLVDENPHLDDASRPGSAGGSLLR